MHSVISPNMHHVLHYQAHIAHRQHAGEVRLQQGQVWLSLCNLYWMLQYFQPM